MTNDIKVINKEELDNVVGGEVIVVDMDPRNKCPNCKSFNFVPICSERFYKWSKIRYLCCNCNNQWMKMIEIPTDLAGRTVH